MEKLFDAIVVGGSYAGLSAALCLSRMKKEVLLLDSRNPANLRALTARNFITHDGDNPEDIREKARAELSNYSNCLQIVATAKSLNGTDGLFSLRTLESGSFKCKKIIFCTGVSDIMPGIAGFADCWGKSIYHCPYCHAMELPDTKLGIIASGRHAFHLVSVLSPMFSEIVLFTNGEKAPRCNDIQIVTSRITGIKHKNGKLQSFCLENNQEIHMEQSFAKVLLKQQCTLPEEAGCSFRGHLIEVDRAGRTTVPGIYAAGDNCHLPRSISLATAAGTRAAFQVNYDLCNVRYPDQL